MINKRLHERKGANECAQIQFASGYPFESR